MMEKSLVTVFVLVAVFILLAVPLILKKVPRNGIYGFRVKATLEDDVVWYEANAYFGRAFLAASLLSAALIVLLYGFNAVPENDFMKASLAVLIIPQLVVVALTLRFIRSIK